MTAKQLLQVFEDWTAEGVPLVLASVYETTGSTYSKTGAQMLITGDGRFQGMLSGGCLEGDLAERAKQVAERGVPQAVSYDLGSNDEELWGLGVGCDGLMRIFLQPLTAGRDYEPLASMLRACAGESRQVAATVIASDVDDLPPGATLVSIDGQAAYCDVAAPYADPLLPAADAVRNDATSTLQKISFDSGAATILYTVLEPPPAILVLGAGLDAEPVVRFAVELGWRVTVRDHRPAYVEAGRWSGAERVECAAVADLGETELDHVAAAIVMSHHLASDREYLRALARTEIPYIGLLGPADRRRRLLEELGDDVADALAGRVHGPAGLDLGGRGPAAIALSIIAEVHRALHDA